MAEHLTERYGEEEIAAVYCRLYDYTEHALHGAAKRARLSGPAVTGIFEGGHAQKFMRFFLDHCRRGANYCTQEKGTRLDFITFHAKGGVPAVSGRGTVRGYQKAGRAAVQMLQ